MSKKKKVNPNATIKEIKSNFKYVSYGPRGPHYEYHKGNFIYGKFVLGSTEIVALYKPSWKNKKIIMFVWNAKTKRWNSLNYTRTKNDML